jgi:hypothetical protein
VCMLLGWPVVLTAARFVRRCARQCGIGCQNDLVSSSTMVYVTKILSRRNGRVRLCGDAKREQLAFGC